MGLTGTDQGLLDREAALANLAEALTQAQDGRGSCIVVEGAAGTGKTALLAAAGAMASSAGLQILRARGGELEREHAFGIIRQLFEPLLRRVPIATRDQLLTGAAAPAAAMLGLLKSGNSSGGAGFAGMDAIYWLTVNLSLHTPVLLTVDDAHWSDASSLRALDYLGRRIGDVRAVLLVTMRPQEPGAPTDLLDRLRSPSEGGAVLVGPLREPAVAELVRRRIPEAEAGLGQAFFEATGGNPFLVQELLRTLSANGDVPQAAEVEETALPSLGEGLRRRIQAVDPRAAELTRWMSVLGDGGRLRTAAALAGLDQAQAGQMAHVLRRIEVLAAEDPFVFVHPLARRSLYDAIPASDRHGAHWAAADMLEAGGDSAERVASQLRLLHPSGSSRVAMALFRAGEQSLAQGAPDEAISWLERALAEHASEPTEAELLATLATAQTLMRDPQAVSTLRRAYEGVQDPRRRGEIATALAYVLALAGAWEEAVATIDQADRELAATDEAVHAELAAVRAAVEVYDPERADSLERHRELYDSVVTGDSWGSRAMASLLAAEAAHRGRVADARRYLRRAQQDELLLSSHGAGSWATPQLLMALIIIEDVDGAAAALERVMTATRAAGATVGMLTATSCQGWLSARCGDLVAAEADLLAALRLIEIATTPMALANIAWFLVDVLIERETVSGVALELERSQLPDQLMETYTGASLLEARGRLKLAGTKPREGIADLRAAGEMLQRLRFAPSTTSWRSTLALALPASQREEALALAEEELELAQECGLPRPVGIALRATGQLAGDPARRVDLLTESVSVFEGSSMRLEHARSLVALGSMLRRTDRRAQARQPLERGLELASASGADRLGRQAQRELLAAGGRPRADLAARAELTASERRVARLAAAGASNAEIAQSLFVSLKTVETHLAHAYAKLGLAGAGSRRRLAELLGA